MQYSTLLFELRRAIFVIKLADDSVAKLRTCGEVYDEDDDVASSRRWEEEGEDVNKRQDRESVKQEYYKDNPKNVNDIEKKGVKYFTSFCGVYFANPRLLSSV